MNPQHNHNPAQNMEPLDRICTLKKYKEDNITWRQVCERDLPYAVWCARNVSSMRQELIQAIEMYASERDPGDVDDDMMRDAHNPEDYFGPSVF